MAAQVLKTGGRILNRASGDVGDANTSYVYFALTSHQFKNWSLLWELVATTLTLEFTNQKLDSSWIDAATATELNALNWDDQTADRTGAATQTTDGEYANDEAETFYIGRVKLLTTNATNSAILEFNAIR